MRKTILYVLSLVIICFAIPMLLTKQFKHKEVMAEPTEISSMVDYNYKEYDTIKLLHKKTNEIEQINLDEYLYGVVSAEMPVDYDIEALKAQAIVARTYTLYKVINDPQKHGDANICDDSTCCQAWISKEDRLARWDQEKQNENWEKIVSAVNATAGKIVIYNGKPINAFFHSNSGRKTEMPINVWGGRDYPYLQSVETSGEENYEHYSSEVQLTKQELFNKVKEKYANLEINLDDNTQIQILDNTESGRVKTLKVGNVNLSGVEARTLFGLRSTNFEIQIENDIVKFSVIGYGHGVGLSQTGSDSLAKQGKNAEEIIKHFYQGVEIINY